MSRSWIFTSLAGLTLGLLFSACHFGGDDPNTCVDCGSGEAVWCHYGLKTEGMCGPNQDLAAFQCIEGGGTWSPATVCPWTPDSETGGNQEPWDPGRDVTLDQEAGEYVIDRLAFEELKLNPAPLLEDETGLRELRDGAFTLSSTGALADALGWRKGDVLLEVNGHPLQGFESFTPLYNEVSDASAFTLWLERDGRAVVLRYRIE